MLPPDQNKIIGKEIAVGPAAYIQLDDKKSGYVFKETLTIDPIVMDMNAVTMESLQDCVEQLEKMGTYEELCKAHGYKDEGYKVPGFVIQSKLDPRIAMGVEFGRRWNKDSDMQAEKTLNKDLTLKWFLNDEHKDQFGVKGVLPEHPASPDELDLLTKIREATKTPEYKQESYQPVLSRIKQGYRMLGEAEEPAFKEKGIWVEWSRALNEGEEDQFESAVEAAGAKDWESYGYDEADGMSRYLVFGVPQDELNSIAKQIEGFVETYFQGECKEDEAMKEHGEVGDDETPQGSYEKHALEPMMKKLAVNPGKLIKKVELTDEFGEPNGEFVKVMQATHPSHENMIGIHLNDPDEQDIDDAVETAAKDGFEYIWVHRSPQQNNACESKTIKGAGMEKKPVHEGIVFNDWDNVDFFGVPKLGEESSDYKPTYKEADSPYVADPNKKDKEVAGKADKLKAPAGDGKEVVMQAGSAIAKPESEVNVGVKSGQAPLADKELEVGKAADGKGDVMQGKGNSDDQQKELPAGEIKVGKAADGKGKVMSDDKKPDASVKPVSEARKTQISELMKKNMSGKMAEMRKKKMQEKMSKRYGK